MIDELGLRECLGRMDETFKRNGRWKEKGRGSGKLAVEKKYGVVRKGRVAKRRMLILGDVPAIPWEMRVAPGVGSGTVAEEKQRPQLRARY